MPDRQPTFINSFGWVEEMADTDDMDLGGLRMTGDIVLTGAEVTGLPAVPSGATAAASKAYVDSVATGLDPKASARAATTTSLIGASWTPSGSGVGKTLTSPTNALTNNDFDGVTTVVGDRVLVKDNAGADEVHNGIYEVTQAADGATVPTVLTRVTDADEDAEVTAGMFLFVTEGTTQADTGWVLVSDDPLTVDTSLLAFSQFSGVGTFSGGDGIDISGNVISVDLTATPGLEFSGGQLQVLPDPAGAVTVGVGGLSVAVGDGVEITGNAVAVDLAAANPGLEFSGGDLQVQVDPAGAILRGASGLAASVDGTSIAINGSNQLSVIGAGDATVLAEDLTAEENLNLGDVVEWGTTNDEVRQCQAARSGGRFDMMGVVTEAGGITAGVSGRVVRRGVATGVLSGATVGDRYWVGSTGGLVNSLASIPAGDWILFVGTARNATDLEVRLQNAGRKNL